jgi:hypothetical protein
MGSVGEARSAASHAQTPRGGHGIDEPRRRGRLEASAWSRWLPPARAVRPRPIWPELEPPQVLPHRALCAAELGGESLEPDVVANVSGSIEVLQTREPELASALLATLAIRGGACASQPRAGHGELALALERDGAGAQGLIGLALQLAVPGERDAGRDGADQPRVGRDAATQSCRARRGKIWRLQGMAGRSPASTRYSAAVIPWARRTCEEPSWRNHRPHR